MCKILLKKLLTNCIKDDIIRIEGVYTHDYSIPSKEYIENCAIIQDYGKCKIKRIGVATQKIINFDDSADTINEGFKVVDTINFVVMKVDRRSKTTK